eukprot:scaffold48493_cov54-Attheya_sp.AAC.5
MPCCLLTGLDPQPECCVYVPEFEVTLGLTAADSYNPNANSPIYPLVSSLSILSMDPSKRSVKDVKIPIFGTEKGEWKECDTSSSISRLVQAVPQMPSLEERLADMARAKPAKEATSRLEDFLCRSQAVVDEFLAAVDQYYQKLQRQQQQSNSTRSRVGGHENASFLPMPFYSAILEQLYTLEQNEQPTNNDTDEKKESAVVDLSDDLSCVTLGYTDTAGRKHELVAELPRSFPFGKPTWTVDLPIVFDPPWVFSATKQNNNDSGSFKPRKRPRSSFGDSENRGKDEDMFGLVMVYECWKEALGRCQGIWDELFDLDSEGWILEPQLPAPRADCTRRIALVDTGLVSMVLTLDETNPRSVPSAVRFLGSGPNVHALRTSYQSYTRDSWSEQESVRWNLQKCLGLTLPKAPNAANSDEPNTAQIAECGICYTHRLPMDEDDDDDEEEPQQLGQLPDALCGNTTCARCYHESCLLEWLQSLPSARISFDRIFGTCPYCFQAISVSTSS